MKKLMVMIGAAATSLGLFADPFVSKTGFEVDAGSKLEALDLEDSGSGATWTATGAEKVEVTEYSGTDVGYPVVPAQFTDNGLKYLSVKTALGTGLLSRKFAEEPVNADGIYVDMNVKFTAFDSDAEIPDDAKIAVWVKEAEDGSYTNLIVTAGYVDGVNRTRKDYIVASNFKYDEWHRVTIKAIGNSSMGSTAFVVFLDPTLDDQLNPHGYALVSEEDKGTEGWLTGFSDSAKAFAAAGQLFPSIVAESTLSEVAFSGTGDIDSVVATDVVPFEEAKDKQFYTLTCGENIASFKVNDETITESKQFLFEGATTAYITDITPAEGYFVDDDEDEISVDEAKDYTVGTAKALAATVTLADGTVIKAASFADAIAAFAEQGGTLTLNALTTVVEGSDPLELAQDVVIDLNGKTLDLGEATLTSTASLTIKDETGLGILTADEEAYALDADELYVTGGNIMTYATYTTAAELSGGSFIDPEAGAEEFYLNEVVVSGKVATWNEETSMFDIETYVPPVAKIDDNEFATLGAAIDALTDAAETIVLQDNYEMTADETKLFAKSATLDLNGKTLTVPAALRTKSASFEIADGATVTFENGTIDLGTVGASYGIAVLGTLNVNCTITRAGASGPVFDSYNGTINFGSNADVTGNYDIVRCKSLRDDEPEAVAVTTTVTVADGAKLTSTGAGIAQAKDMIPMFYCYKTCTTLNATLNGGEFTAAKAVFGDDGVTGDKKNETWVVTIDAEKAKFANDKIEFGTAVDEIIPNQKPILNEGWYYLADAIKVVEPVVGEGATLAGVAAGDKFAAGETVAFTVTADDETVKVIDTVTVNSETLTAGEAGAYSWTVPEKMPAAIEIVVTTKAPAVGPSSDEGQFSKPDASTGRVTFTPADPAATEVTINLNGFAAGVEVPGTIATIKGVPANQLKIQLNGYEIDNKYFVGGDAEGFSTALSDEAKAQLVEATEDVKPLEIGDDVDVTINTVPGLKYQLIRGAEVGAIETAIGEPVVGDGEPLKLTDAEKPEGKAFYVIRTTK